jgi:hypothetical protein
MPLFGGGVLVILSSLIVPVAFDGAVLFLVKPLGPALLGVVFGFAGFGAGAAGFVVATLRLVTPNLLSLGLSLGALGFVAFGAAFDAAFGLDGAGLAGSAVRPRSVPRLGSGFGFGFGLGAGFGAGLLSLPPPPPPPPPPDPILLLL